MHNLLTSLALYFAANNADSKVQKMTVDEHKVWKHENENRGLGMNILKYYDFLTLRSYCMVQIQQFQFKYWILL